MDGSLDVSRLPESWCSYSRNTCCIALQGPCWFVVTHVTWKFCCVLGIGSQILFVCDISLKHAQKNQTLDSNHVQMVVKERAEIANRWLLTSTLASSLLKHFFRTIDHNKCNEKQTARRTFRRWTCELDFLEQASIWHASQMMQAKQQNNVSLTQLDSASKTAKQCFTRPVRLCKQN